MRCPNCNSEDVVWSGTYFKGWKFDKACNNCGYIWNVKEEESK